jgi:hypothetical protein
MHIHVGFVTEQLSSEAQLGSKSAKARTTVMRLYIYLLTIQFYVAYDFSTSS